jgi:hypothetical protein
MQRKRISAAGNLLRMYGPIGSIAEGRRAGKERVPGEGGVGDGGGLARGGAMQGR